MLFSERHGYKKADKKLLWKNMPRSLRNQIWNVFYICVFQKIECTVTTPTNKPIVKFLHKLWMSFCKQDISVLRGVPAAGLYKTITQLFWEFKWNRIYDFIEFFATYYEDKTTIRTVLNRVNKILNEERAPYRIVNEKVIPLTSEEEIKEIEKVYNIPDKYGTVKDHLEKALKFFSMRPDPDYTNSIKESISAVDLLVQIILGKEGSLGKLIDGLEVHPALKKGFSNLYGWTSDDAGIRHPKFKEPISCDEPEARYMLITCSAFVNYAINKIAVT